MVSTPCQPRENQLALCLVLGPERLSHYLGIYVSVTMKDDCHSFSTGRSLASPGAQAAGGGAVQLGAGWGFDFRGICNGWEPPWAHGGSGLFWEANGWPRGRERGGLVQTIRDSALSVGTGRAHDGQGKPTQVRGFSHLPGAQGFRIKMPLHPSPGNKKRRSCWPVRGLWLLA